MRHLSIVLVFLLWLTKVAVYAQKPTTSTVTMTLEEYEQVFTAAKLETEMRSMKEKVQQLEKEHQRIQSLNHRQKELEYNYEKQRKQVFPNDYQVLSYTAQGVFEGVPHDAALFQMQMLVRVSRPPSPQWTSIPIISNSMLASDWQLSYRPDDTNTFQSIHHEMDPTTMLVLRNNHKVLATNLTGLFRISHASHVRVSKTRNIHAIGMSHLLYPLSNFSLQVSATNNNNNTRMVRDFSVQPSSAILQVNSMNNYTQVKAVLPLNTTDFQVKWLEVATDDGRTEDRNDREETTRGGHHNNNTPEPSAQESMVATVEELHSVGEGIIWSKHLLELKASEVSSKFVEFWVVGNPHETRVTSVAGYGLQSWKVEDAENSSQKQLVKATFKSSTHLLDSSVASLVIQTETDMPTKPPSDNNSTKTKLPRIECKNVLRQSGHVAVSKDANVEIHQDSKTGLSRCEAAELSSQLRHNTYNQPIVLSYKIKSPRHELVLDVKEHVAMNVVESTIDRYHYQAQVMDTQIVHSVILNLQTTQLQYLELHNLPDKAAMFTLHVNSIPTKPVKGHNNNSILIPLLVGLKSSSEAGAGNLQTSVELNFFSPHEMLGRTENGTLVLNPPQIHLPISILTVHLRLPELYKYDFLGDFTRDERMLYPVPTAFAYYQTGKRMVEKDYKFSFIDDVWPEDENVVEKQQPGGIKIVTPTTGRSFHFHRLLVLDENPLLTANYKTPVKESEKSSLWSSFFMV